MRPYHADTDNWRIRDFLRAVYLRNGRRELAWQPYRWDYGRWHGWENIFHLRPEDVTFLWETVDGDLAAVLSPEDPGEAFVHAHPDRVTPADYDDILVTAETRLAVPRDEGPYLRVWANETDAPLQAALARRGYTRGPRGEHQRRQPITLPIPDAPLPAGYTVRALGDVEEHPARSWLSWQAFHPDEPAEAYQGWTWYRNVQRCPLYRRDLDLVVVAPDGTLAAFATVWFDDVTLTGSFEPVGTAPAHQRRGLGRAILAEGLRRLAWYGATQATVGSYGPGAGALYAAAGFTQYDMGYPWTWRPA